MICIRSIFLLLIIVIMHERTHAQEKPDLPNQEKNNLKNYPQTYLIFNNGSIHCGYYDSSKNVLYDCDGNIILNKAEGINRKSPGHCCTDTDGDCVNDDEDKCINEPGPASNFGCPQFIISDPARVVVQKKNIFFSPASSGISSTSVKLLKLVTGILKDNPSFKVYLDGYTDNAGDYELNIKLSMKRVQAAKSFLLRAGVNDSRITCDWHGPEEPIDTNKTKAGRAKNNRVEILLYNY